MEIKFTRDFKRLKNANLDSEWYGGATNINGAVGNGRLTAGISFWGEVTVLRWPRLSHFDQLRYRTVHGFPFRNYHVRMGKDAPCPSYRRWGRPGVVSENMGSFAGLFLPASGKTSWFHDPAWESGIRQDCRRQVYQPPDTNVLLTEARNQELDISVRIEDLVAPDMDVLARRFTLDCGPRVPAGEACLVYYVNGCPSLARSRYYPVVRRIQEWRSDYLCLYHPALDAILHFRPTPRPFDWRAQSSRLNGSPGRIEGYVANLDNAFPGGGVYVAWGGGIESDGFQVGTCGNGSESLTCDAFLEARSGKLSSNHVAGRPANSALSFDLQLSAGAKLEVPVFIALADRAQQALGLIEQSRAQGFDRMLDGAVRHWSGFIEDAKIPDCGDSTAHRVARRSMLALAVGTDEASGAIVASVSRQPQYCFDWIRDGAFIDCALDMAGYPDRVTRHADFYTRVQLKRGRLGKKRGEFEGHYYADGRMGPIPFVEIDETGLGAWTLWRHARYLPPEERDGYLERVYPSIRMSAQALMRMRPRGGGLQRRAHEDDNIFRLTSTLHGATSTYLGLKSAIEAGRQAAEDSTVVSGWSSWANELKEAIIGCFDPQSGEFRREGWRGRSWVIWPAMLLPLEDRRIQAQAEYLFGLARAFTRKETDGFAYVAELLIPCALAWRNSPDKLARVREALKVMTSEVPTPGTGHFGEVTLIGDFAGGGEPVYQNRAAMPHLWEGALLYLALAAAYRPDWIDFASEPFSW